MANGIYDSACPICGAPLKVRATLTFGELDLTDYGYTHEECGDPPTVDHQEVYCPSCEWRSEELPLSDQAPSRPAKLALVGQ